MRPTLTTLLALALCSSLALAATTTHNFQVKRGPAAQLPATAKMGEPLFATDTRELYIGYSTGRVKMIGENQFGTYTGAAKAARAALVPKTTTVNGQALTGNVTISASDVGLGNVSNTSDANKPVSTAQQSALDLKANINNPTFTGVMTVPAVVSSAPDGQRIIECSNSGAMDTTGLTATNAGAFCYDRALAKYRYWNGTALADWPGGAAALSALTDTTIATPQTNDFLRYNGTAWVNQAVTIPADVSAAVAANAAKFANLSSQVNDLKVAMLAAGFPAAPLRVTPATQNYASPTNDFTLNFTSPAGTSLAYVYNGGASTAMTSGVDVTGITAPTANTPYNYTVTATKTATGYTASTSGTLTFQQAILGWSPSSYDFGNVAQNTTSAHQTFTLTNTGPVDATGLSLTTGNAIFGNHSSSCGSTLAAGANCTVKTSATPTATGLVTSYLRAAATGLSNLDAALTVTGVTPACSGTPSVDMAGSGNSYIVGDTTTRNFIGTRYSGAGSVNLCSLAIAVKIGAGDLSSKTYIAEVYDLTPGTNAISSLTPVATSTNTISGAALTSSFVRQTFTFEPAVTISANQAVAIRSTASADGTNHAYIEYGGNLSGDWHLGAWNTTGGVTIDNTQDVNLAIFGW